MIIQCENCKTKFRLDDSRVTPAGIRVRCSRCSHTFVVKRDQPEETVDFDSILDGLGAGESERSAEDSDTPMDEERGTVQPEAPSEPEPRTGSREEEEEREEEQDIGMSGELAEGINSLIDSLSGSEDVLEPEASAAEPEVDLESTTQEPREEDLPEESFSNFLRKGVGLPQFQGVAETDANEEAPGPQAEDESAGHAATAGDDQSGDDDSAVVETESESPASGEHEPVPEPSPLSSISADSGENLSIRQHLWPVADSKDEEPAEDEMPPLSITSRRKQSPLVMIAVGVFLLLALGAVGYFMLVGQSDALDGVLPESLRTALGIGKQEKGPVVIRALEGAFLANKEAGEIFVVKGEAFNVSSKALRTIQVKGKIFGPKGDVLMQRAVYCGNLLAGEQMAFQPYSSMEKIMNREFGETLANLDVQPGTAIPFVIVFKDVPKSAKDFGVEVVPTASSAR
ncbi:MAG TPA: DUF3426 domain-containing protein [Geobacteraceae bacterium]|nr:DUF3426 domain-containing protein [Geobacteraceae bacterium]